MYNVRRYRTHSKRSMSNISDQVLNSNDEKNYENIYGWNETEFVIRHAESLNISIF